MSKYSIPLLKAEDPEGLEAIQHVFYKGDFIGGRDIEHFEENWAVDVGAHATVALSSGTMALTLLLRSLNFQGIWRARQDVVIPATSFVATRDAVLHAGLRPIVCDVDRNGLMNPVALGKVLRRHHERVIAVMPVHLYGQVADVGAIDAIRKSFDVPYLIEDACQAHGACYPGGSPVGSKFPAAWSFMPAKILGGCGDGGAITLPDSDWYEHFKWLRSARNHGRTEHSVHEFPGWKARMDTIKAAYLNYKLRSLTDAIHKRSHNAWLYSEALGHLDLRLQPNSYGRVWTYYALWAPDETKRDSLRECLYEDGIQTGMHYPYSFDEYYNPIASELHRRTLSLPFWPDMSEDDISEVACLIESHIMSGKAAA